MASFAGIGFGGTRCHHDSGGSASLDAAMQQNTNQRQEGSAFGRRDAPDTSFVAAHIVDPNYRYYTESFAPPPPPPPPPPPLNLPPPPTAISAAQNWAIQGSHAPAPMHLPTAGLPQVPPNHQPDYGGPHVSRSPSSSFSAYGNVALQRRTLEEDVPSIFPTPVPANTSDVSDQIKSEVQLARDRAMKIIQKLHDNDPTKVESEIARKRKESFEQLEQRKRLALVKNLEYLAKAEDNRLRTKLIQVKKAKELQQQLESYHQQSLQTRLQHLGKGRNGSETNTMKVVQSQAGIGTQQRQQTEQKRRKQQQLASSDSVALYVSNLPTDGSAGEELLHALFGGLGFSLRKIHFYVNKQTGELKGDALVVYELASDKDRNILTETVCSQMNGAELPCGTALRVEPSDPLYKLRKSKEQNNSYGPASKSTLLLEAPEMEEKVEDLDDFFATLDGEDETEQGKTIEESSTPNKEGDEDEDDLDGFFESLS